MHIAITGGGTGGHLAIARAIKEELNALGHQPVFIGSETGQDRSWFENDSGFETTYFLSTRGVVNQKGLGKFASLFQILQASRSCIKFFKQHGITRVFSVGGFSAAPASLAAILTNRPLYIHEQNAIKGSLNKILTPFARTVFSSYDPSSPIKDYPVSQRFFDICRIRDEIKTVIFLGGSQGALAINEFALQIAPKLQEKGIKIIHQAGKAHAEKVAESYKNMGVKADVFAFDPNLLEKIKTADFAVSRAGASTLWELAATGVPTLFIPFPYAAGDHQYHNARFLSEQNLAFLKRQKELDEAYFWQCLESDIESISRGLQNTIQPGAAKKIVQKLLDAG